MTITFYSIFASSIHLFRIRASTAVSVSAAHGHYNIEATAIVSASWFYMSGYIYINISSNSELKTVNSLMRTTKNRKYISTK